MLKQIFAAGIFGFVNADFCEESGVKRIEGECGQPTLGWTLSQWNSCGQNDDLWLSAAQKPDETFPQSLSFLTCLCR